MRYIALFIICLNVIPSLVQAASLQIYLPQNGDKIVVGEEFMAIHAVFSMPENEAKEEEAIIIWEIQIGNQMLTAQTKSDEASTMNMTPASFPFSNSAFGDCTLTASVNNMQFSGNENYDGADSLGLTVIENTGIDYTGYIVPAANAANQDMVIGEDTSDLPGCFYSISGFCSEPHKHAPHQGDLMGTPWTSEDPGHWAYWIRQAVKRAAESDTYDDDTILDAVWYIVQEDRSMMNNPLLAEIGFSEKGPFRPDESEPPRAPQSLQVTNQFDRLDFEWENPPDTDVVEILLIGFNSHDLGSINPEFTPALLADVDISTTVLSAGPSVVQTFALHGLYEDGALLDNLLRQYAAIAIDASGDWSTPGWAKTPSALKINKWNLSLNQKKPEKSKLVSSGELYALPDQINLLSDGFTFNSIVDSAGIRNYFKPYFFTEKPRGRYVYKPLAFGFGLDPTLDVKGKFSLNIGGSSRSKYAFLSKGDYSAMQGKVPVSTAVYTGEFQTDTVIQPALKGAPSQGGAKGSMFRLKKENYESNEMYVESFVANKITNKDNKDSLRFTLYIAGESLFGEGPADLGIYSNWLTLQIDDSMWTQNSDGGKLTYTQTGESGETMVVKVDKVKSTLSFFARNTKLDITESDTGNTTLGLVTSVHSHVNSLKLRNKTNKKHTTFYY